MLRKFIFILLVVGSCRTAPSTYDQRQDGDVNVKVDLDNFVILIARPVSAFDVFGSMSQLFVDSKNSQLNAQIEPKEQQQQQQLEAKMGDEEIKKDTGEPPKLDSEANVMKGLEPIVIEESSDEGEKTARSLEDVAKSLRDIKAKEVGKLEKEKSKLNSGKYKFVESVEEPESLKLIGDSIENCGPGRSRDRLGICQEDITQ